MLRLITYLIALLKLISLGRWYPPGHVRDVSAEDFGNMLEVVNELTDKITAVERQAEATRKKVYRDEVEVKGEEPVIVSKDGGKQEVSTLAGLQAGDEVPPGLL
jgi:hypothetical protein